MNQSSIQAPLGRLVSGLYIVTAKTATGEETGMLSSWVMQAGFEPPMLTVAVKLGRYLEEWLTAGTPFNVNILSESQNAMLKHFGRGFEPGEPAFEGLDITRCSRGVVILTGTLGHLECEPSAHLDSADHRLFLAKITGGQLQSEQSPWSHVRKNGMRY